MAVSVKKIRPVSADISASLSMLSERNSEEAEKIRSAETAAEEKITGTKKNLSGNQDEKPAAKDTQIVFRTTGENKSSLKGFFASHGLTLSKGIQMACLYFEQQIKSGGVEIGPSGILSSGGGR